MSNSYGNRAQEEGLAGALRIGKGRAAVLAGDLEEDGSVKAASELYAEEIREGEDYPRVHCDY